jgi:hypothetical protein
MRCDAAFAVNRWVCHEVGRPALQDMENLVHCITNKVGDCPVLCAAWITEFAGSPPQEVRPNSDGRMSGTSFVSPGARLLAHEAKAWRAGL